MVMEIGLFWYCHLDYFENQRSFLALWKDVLNYWTCGYVVGRENCVLRHSRTYVIQLKCILPVSIYCSSPTWLLLHLHTYLQLPPLPFSLLLSPPLLSFPLFSSFLCTFLLPSPLLSTLPLCPSSLHLHRPAGCLVVPGPGMIHALPGVANATVNCW